MLEDPAITGMSPTLYSMHENLVLPCLQSEDPQVRCEGIRALGLMCLLTPDLASQHLLLFVQVGQPLLLPRGG